MNKEIRKGKTILEKEGFFSLLQRALSFYYISAKRSVEMQKYWISILRRQIRHRYSYHSVASPYKIVFIDPDRISTYTNHFNSKWESVGAIVGGDWDKQTIRLSKTKKYSAIYEHFCKDKEWEATGVYTHLLQQLENLDKNKIDGCQNEEELKKRYKKVDKLYESLRRGGYDQDYHNEPPKWWGFKNMDYVSVHIGRDGQLIFAGSGWHRLAISQILEIEEIPVWIRARHEIWQQLRDNFAEANKEEDISDDLVAYINHPDLKDIMGDIYQNYS